MTHISAVKTKSKNTYQVLQVSHLCHPPKLRFLTFHQIHITRLWVLFSFGLVVQNVLLLPANSSLNWNTILFTVEEKCHGWLVFKLLHVCLVLVYIQKKTKVRPALQISKKREVAAKRFLFRAASSMNNMGSLAAMPVSISSPPCPEEAAGRGRKD